MSSNSDLPSSPSQPQLHLGRSQLNAAAVDRSESSHKSGPPSEDAATPSSSVPGYSHSREKAEKNGEYESSFSAKLSDLRRSICVYTLSSCSEETLPSNKKQPLNS